MKCICRNSCKPEFPATFLKQSASTELLRAICVVAGGGNYLDPAITGKVFDGYSRRNRKKSRGELCGEPLTGREKEVLQQVAWGFSNKDNAEKMGYIGQNRRNAQSQRPPKLNIKRRNDIVRYAVLQGWLQEN